MLHDPTLGTQSNWKEDAGKGTKATSGTGRCFSVLGVPVGAWAPRGGTTVHTFPDVCKCIMGESVNWRERPSRGRRKRATRTWTRPRSFFPSAGRRVRRWKRTEERRVGDAYRHP